MSDRQCGGIGGIFDGCGGCSTELLLFFLLLVVLFCNCGSFGGSGC